MSYSVASYKKQLDRLAIEGKKAFDHLQTTISMSGESLSLYHAGKQGGSLRFGLFGRDLLTVALMIKDKDYSEAVLRFVCATIGDEYDPHTGEEPGRAIHEHSEVMMRGLSTKYNAVEVSMLLLIVATEYRQLTDSAELLLELRKPLISAMDYVTNHIVDGFVIEDPARCGADHYAIPATYWKDSGLPQRNDPAFPVTYTLVQAQAIGALRAAAELSTPLCIEDKIEEFQNQVDALLTRLTTDLWDEERNFPVIAIDEDGGVCGVSSDGLHMLAYLRNGDIPSSKLEGISVGARQLLTPYGYRTYAPGEVGYNPHAYHLGAIWPHEHFFVAQGAMLHNLPDIMEESARPIQAIETLGFVELYYWDKDNGLGGPGVIPGEGCDLQLWSAALPQALVRLANETATYHN